MNIISGSININIYSIEHSHAYKMSNDRYLHGNLYYHGFLVKYNLERKVKSSNFSLQLKKNVLGWSDDH